ncbi:DUF222 domain-containing protein [Nocardioides aquiterrae]
MGPEETAATLVELTRVIDQAIELQARVAAHADTLHVGQDVGASSAAAWLAHETKTTRGAAHGAVRLGRDLETHPATRDALAAGGIHVEQARVILRWIDDLPDDLDRDLVAKAEAHLLEQANHHVATALNRLGRRLFEVIAPDEADAREAALLAKEEAAAPKACRLTGYDDGTGKAHFTGTLPSHQWAALKKMLAAIASSKHQTATKGAGAAANRPPTPEAMGQALRADRAVPRRPAPQHRRHLGDHGGVHRPRRPPRPAGEGVPARHRREDLPRPGPAAGVRGRDHPRRPGRGLQPLDVGRKSRYFTEAQRIAMLVRDRGCRAESCDRVSGLHAHHKQRWVDGGHTNLTDGVSLCHWHHNRAHDTGYTTTYHPNGDVTFHRRT